jgi:hypothetical protein
VLELALAVRGSRRISRKTSYTQRHQSRKKRVLDRVSLRFMDRVRVRDEFLFMISLGLGSG